jgi:hypothetical protein
MRNFILRGRTSWDFTIELSEPRTIDLIQMRCPEIKHDNQFFPNPQLRISIPVTVTASKECNVTLLLYLRKHRSWISQAHDSDENVFPLNWSLFDKIQEDKVTLDYRELAGLVKRRFGTGFQMAESIKNGEPYLYSTQLNSSLLKLHSYSTHATQMLLQ